MRITFKPQCLIPSSPLPIDIDVNGYLFSPSHPRGQSDEGQRLTQSFGDEQGSAENLRKTALGNHKTQVLLTFHSNNGIIIAAAAAIATTIGSIIKSRNSLCSQISTSRP